MAQRQRGCHGPHTAIASLSLGATRKFSFRHKQRRERRDMLLHHGQLIVMRGATQRHWLHAVDKTAVAVGPRISLTFRTFGAGLLEARQPYTGREDHR